MDIDIVGLFFYWILAIFMDI